MQMLAIIIPILTFNMMFDVRVDALRYRHTSGIWTIIKYYKKNCIVSALGFK